MSLLRLWTSRAMMALIVVLIAVGLAYSFPMDVAFLMAIDLGTWIEAAVAIYVVSSVTRIRPIVAILRTRLFALRKRSRRRTRTPAASKRMAPSNDEDPAQAFAVAA